MKGPLIILTALALASAPKAQMLSLASQTAPNPLEATATTADDRPLLVKDLILDSMQTGSRLTQPTSDLLKVLRTNNPTANDPKSPYSVTLQNSEGKYALSVDVRSQKSTDGEVYLVNVNGEKVLTIHKGVYKTGMNEFPVETKSLAPGLYYAVTVVGDRQFAEKITVGK
jgi:hypothetical protein